MQKYWARHQGSRRWGVKPAPQLETSDDTYRSEAGHLFIWADEARIEGGVLEFRDTPPES